MTRNFNNKENKFSNFRITKRVLFKFSTKFVGNELWLGELNDRLIHGIHRKSIIICPSEKDRIQVDKQSIAPLFLK